jgi:hypothetical protein
MQCADPREALHKAYTLADQEFVALEKRDASGAFLTTHISFDLSLV